MRPTGLSLAATPLEPLTADTRRARPAEGTGASWRASRTQPFLVSRKMAEVFRDVAEQGSFTGLRVGGPLGAGGTRRPWWPC